MMSYNNLKELLQKEYSNQLIDLLNQWTSRSFVSSPDYATGVEILTLNCQTQGDPPLFKLLLGVSAELTNRVTQKPCIRYYNIDMIGVSPLQLVDFKVVSIEEASRASLEPDTIFSLFSLPYFPIEKLEEFADILRSQCCEDIDNDQKHQYFFPVIEVKKKLNLRMWPADLPDNCLGRFYTKVSSATIYDPMFINNPHHNTPIPPGAILLNINYYKNKFSPDDMITSTHELVHYLIHRPFIAITQYLYAEKNYLECSSEPEILEEGMSDTEKALFYAEWQANELSIRIVMPKKLVEKTIAEYDAKHYKKGATKDGAYYQDMISELSLSFNVPITVTKKRLRQLGYDFADGVSSALAADLLIRRLWDKINYDYIPPLLTDINKHMTTSDNTSVYGDFPESQGLRFPPFSFSAGKLNEDETFVISPESYEQLLNENTLFSELINSGACIYLGYVVCHLDRRYICCEEKNSVIHFFLTPYAMNHVDECCIKFKVKNVATSRIQYNIYTVSYLCKIPEYNEVVLESLELNEEDNGLDDKTIEDIEDYVSNMKALNSEQCSTWSNTLIFHMQRKNIEPEELKNNTGLAISSIKGYYENKKAPDKRNVMALCIGLKLEQEYCDDFFVKAGYPLNKNSPQDMSYRYLFNYTHSGIDFCNKILSKLNQDPLPYHKGNGKNVKNNKT